MPKECKCGRFCICKTKNNKIIVQDCYNQSRYDESSNTEHYSLESKYEDGPGKLETPADELLYLKREVEQIKNYYLGDNHYINNKFELIEHNLKMLLALYGFKFQKKHYCKECNGTGSKGEYETPCKDCKTTGYQWY